MARFHSYIGIDYSGSGTPLTRTAGLQVYLATADRLPKRVNPPSTPKGRNRNWCRNEVAEWLIGRARSGKTFIAGLDFSFSLRLSYFQRYGLGDWDSFLADFVEHWPTDRDEVFPPMLRRRYPTEGRTVDQQDAYAVARWLREVGWGRVLDDVCLGPPMTGREEKVAELEGWILGVT